VPISVVAVIALLGFRAATNDTTSVLAATAADGASILLPDGTEVDGVAGLELPDGSVIALSRGGTLIVDGREYHDPMVFDVVDGELRARPAPGLGTDPARPADRAPAPFPTSSSTPASPPNIEPEIVTGPAVTTSTSTTIGPTPGPGVVDPTVADRPPPTAPPVSDLGPTISPPAATTTIPVRPTTTIAPPVTTTSAPRASTTISAPIDRRPILLTSSPLRAGRWRLAWEMSDPTGVAGWVVRAVAGPSDGDAREVAVIRDPAARHLIVTPPGDARTVRYLIEARSRTGELIARSEPVPLS